MGTVVVRIDVEKSIKSLCVCMCVCLCVGACAEESVQTGCSETTHANGHTAV